MSPPHSNNASSWRTNSDVGSINPNTPTTPPATSARGEVPSTPSPLHQRRNRGISPGPGLSLGERSLSRIGLEDRPRSALAFYFNSSYLLYPYIWPVGSNNGFLMSMAFISSFEHGVSGEGPTTHVFHVFGTYYLNV